MQKTRSGGFLEGTLKFFYKVGLGLAGALVLGFIAPQSSFAVQQSPTIQIDHVLVSGHDIGTACASGTVTVQGSGNVFNQQSPEDHFHVQIDWGDGSAIQDGIAISATAVGNPKDKNFSYTFNVQHTYAAASSAIIASLYHAQGSGKDFDASVTKNICVTPPPTTGSLLVKTVVNTTHGGSATPFSFILSVTGTGATPSSFNGSTAGTTVTFGPGLPSSYSVTPSSLTGYTVVSNDCSGTISAGDSRTCTVTIGDVAPHLTVIKHVVNNYGGTLQAGAFLMTVTGTNVAPNASFSGSENGTTVTLNAGSFSVAEGANSGYAQSLSGDCSGSISLGDNKSCTITNSDIQPVLKVIKHVVNGDTGRTAVASDFTLAVTGASASPSSFQGDEAGTTVNLNAGHYSVDETSGMDGYVKTLGDNCAGTIAVGQTIQCTITNTATPKEVVPQPATLVLKKHVINDNGGELSAQDFTIHVTGSAPESTPVDRPGSETGTTYSLAAGTYTITEDGASGYELTGISGDQACGPTITLNAGDSLNCTLTNDDIAPQLTIVKHIINDNGGTITDPSAFTFKIDGQTEPQGQAVALNAGSHTVSEDAFSGYAASVWGGACNADGTIVLKLGENATCSITNDDIAPRLTVIKKVINNNGGSKTASEFNLAVTGTNVVLGDLQPSSKVTFPAADDPGITVTLDAGTFSVSEANYPDYATSMSDACSGTIAIGETKICTVTNDDIAPNQGTLTVLKHVVGSETPASNFSIHVKTSDGETLTDVSGSPQPGSESGTAYVLSSGTYTVSENAAEGFNLTFSDACPQGVVIIGAGDNKTCTLTNTAVQNGGGGGGNPAPPTSGGGSGNGAADLEVTVTFNPASTTTSSTVTMTVHVRNFGDLAANGVTVHVTVPSGLTIQSSAADQGTFDSTALVWNAGTILNGDSTNLNIVLNVPGGVSGSLSGSASVSSLVTDSNTSNNNSSALLAVVAGAETTGLPSGGNDGSNGSGSPAPEPQPAPPVGNPPPVTISDSGSGNDGGSHGGTGHNGGNSNQQPQGQVLGTSTTANQPAPGSDKNNKKTVACKINSPLAWGILIGYVILMGLLYWFTRKKLALWYIFSVVLFIAGTLAWKFIACSGSGSGANWLLPAAMILVFLIFEFLVDMTMKKPGEPV